MNRGIAGVNEVLFRQLDRLESVDRTDAKAMQAEIARSKAVQQVAGKVIENGRLVLDVAKAGVAAGEAVKLPKGLLGE
jgi:hypothetical protein|nr:MAG TPA_asm: hypothetical protein [Caudoviricetes sp.]